MLRSWGRRLVRVLVALVVALGCALFSELAAYASIGGTQYCAQYNGLDLCVAAQWAGVAAQSGATIAASFSASGRQLELNNAACSASPGGTRTPATYDATLTTDANGNVSFADPCGVSAYGTAGAPYLEAFNVGSDPPTNTDSILYRYGTGWENGMTGAMIASTDPVVAPSQVSPGCTPSSGPAPLAVKCTATYTAGSSAASVITYAWGDGSPSDTGTAGVAVAHTFQAVGSDSVTATVQDSDGGSATGSQTVNVQTPSCGAGVTDLAAGYSGQNLTVRFHWGSTAPAGGWDVYAPDPGNVSSYPAVTGTVSPSATVDGEPGYFFVTIPLAAAPSPMTVRVVSTDPAQPCFAAGSVSSNAVGSGATQSGAGGSSQPASCALWDLPCWFQKLFFPSASLTQWQTFESNAQNKPPLSVIIGGIPYLQAAIGDFSGVGCSQQGTQLPDCNTGVFSTQGLVPSNGGDPSLPINYPHFDLLAGAATDMGTSWGKVLFTLEQIAVWASCCYLVWGRLSRSFGGKDS